MQDNYDTLMSYLQLRCWMPWHLMASWCTLAQLRDPSSTHIGRGSFKTWANRYAITSFPPHTTRTWWKTNSEDIAVWKDTSGSAEGLTSWVKFVPTQSPKNSRILYGLSCIRHDERNSELKSRCILCRVSCYVHIWRDCNLDYAFIENVRAIYSFFGAQCEIILGAYVLNW